MLDITLMGRGPSWKECAFRTKELWGSATCLTVEGMDDKNFTKVFAFDDASDEFTDPTGELRKAIEIARKRNIPIVSTRDYATEPYPLIDIARKFRVSYFMPTMSHMIAYALYLGYDRLYIYGIDAGPQWYYQFGKPHIIFWIGFAMGKGIDVRLGKGSLRWAYQSGMDTFPRAIMIDEYPGTPERIDSLISK